MISLWCNLVSRVLSLTPSRERVRERTLGTRLVVVRLETAANWCPAPSNTQFSLYLPRLHNLLYFLVGRYNKTLNDWPHGKQWVLFPLHPQWVYLATPKTYSLSGKQNCFYRRQHRLTIPVCVVDSAINDFIGDQIRLSKGDALGF